MAVRLNPPKNGHRYKVLSYQRVSRDRKETGSHTFETQEMRIQERLQDLCGAHGYDLVELKDDGISGGYGPVPTRLERRTRPTLKRLVEELETGTYDVLIVYSFSRFARSARWWHQLLEDAILGTNTSFVSVTQPWDLGNAEERVLAGVQALFDGQYRDAASKRNRDAALTRAQQGYVLGDVGYGWRWEPRADVPQGGRRRVFPVPEQRQWVVWMKDRYLAGASLGKIAVELTELGVPTPSGKPKWIFVTVQKVLRNPLHAGLVPSREGPFKGEHYERRFWDPEVLEQLKEASASRRQWAKTNTAKETAHLLNGLAHCARCGERLYSQSPNPKNRVYYCRTGKDHGKLTCPLLRVPEVKLDEAVVEQIERVAKEPKMQALLLAEAENAANERDASLRAEAAQLRSTIASIQERRDALLDALTRKTITDARYQQYDAKLHAEQAAAEQRLGQAEHELQNRQRRERWAAQLKETVLQFPQVWKHLHMHERREVLFQLLESLTVDRQDRIVTVRIKIHLLPEQVITIDLGKRVRPKKRHQTGVLSLTPRQLALLHWIDAGKTPQEAAVLMEVSYTTVRQLISQIRKRLGTQVLADAAAQARTQVKVKLPTLPLGHMSSPQFGGDAIKPSAKVLELLPFWASGATIKEVAQETGLKESTVSGRRRRIFDLLAARTNYEMVQKARRLGWL